MLLLSFLFRPHSQTRSEFPHIGLPDGRSNRWMIMRRCIIGTAFKDEVVYACSVLSPTGSDAATFSYYSRSKIEDALINV